MNIYRSSLFPHIIGDSLVKPVTLTIETITEETLFNGHGEEVKLVLHFVESKKGLILNKTNAKKLAKMFGGETEDWTGRLVELYAKTIRAFGSTHNAVRLREAPAATLDRERRQVASELTTNEQQTRLEDNPLQPPADANDPID